MIPCWACGAPTVPSARLAPLPFLACPACGLAQRDDRDAEELGGIYEEGGYEEEWAGEYAAGASLEDRRRDAQVRLDWMGDRVPPGGTIVDVGAAGGAFVEQAGLRGLRAWGIEPAPAFAQYARDILGVDVRTGLVRAAPVPDRRQRRSGARPEGAPERRQLPTAALDAVTMWHVLEHVTDPVGVLTGLQGALRPCGVLCVEVPNADSAVARALGRDWPGLQPEVHVGQYTPDALGRLLERAGFAVLELSTAPSHVYFTRRDRLGPRNLLHRARFDWVARPRPGRPAGAHDLLRAVAARPPIV
jgi:SAM-dependent methyltransferase